MVRRLALKFVTSTCPRASYIKSCFVFNRLNVAKWSLKWSFIHLILALILFESSNSTLAAASFQQVGSTLVMSNGNVRLVYNLNAGTTDFYWQNSKKISAFYSGVSVSSGYIEGLSYTNWNYSLSGGNQAIVTALGSGLPEMR